jgi:type VII secretion-associated serine protease mycosin
MLVVAVAVALATPSFAAPVPPAGATGTTNITGAPRAPGPAVPVMTGSPVEGSSLLVRFRSPISIAGARDVAARHGARLDETVDGTGFAVVATAPGAAGDVLKDLAADPRVATAEPNYVRQAAGVPSDPHYAANQAAYLDALHLPAAWDLTTGADDQILAVVDSGVTLDHPELAGRLLPGRDVANDDNDPDDFYGHGTQVATVAAATGNDGAGMAGIDWRGKILPVKVLDSRGTGRDSDIAAGIVWAADQGADVINLSLFGRSSSQTVRAAIEYAQGQDALIIAAAGNDHSTSKMYPAAYDGVIAVSAVTGAGDLASFSNYGPWVDLAAPGVDVLAGWADGTYRKVEGTSFAAPLVAGVAMLARARYPDDDAEAIAARLQAGARDAGVPGRDDMFGYGILDALGALGGPPLPDPAPVPEPPLEPPPSVPDPLPLPARSGYWMLGAAGAVYPFGDATAAGDATAHLQRPDRQAADIEPIPGGGGYWLVDTAGAVFAFDAPYLGGVDGGDLRPGESVTSLSATPGGQGYWIFTTRGRVFAFGDAEAIGDLGDVTLNGPVLDSIATPSGRGYYMVAADGGIFSFGDARFFGSMGGITLNAPVQSLVPDPDGTGYWLVAADGGVFSFEAGFRGSLGGITLNAPVTGMVPFGSGYLMVATDGGIFNFSDRPFHGSLGADPTEHPIVAVAAL